MEIYFELDIDIFYCNSFSDRVRFYSINPPLNITYNNAFDLASLKCRAEVNRAMFYNTEALQKNFTLFFECDACNNGYQIGLKEVQVNQ